MAAEVSLSLSSIMLNMFSIVTTILLLADVDGVPDYLLLAHLRSVRFVHSLPTIFAYLGIWTSLFAYMIDITERLGCHHGVTGLIICGSGLGLSAFLWWVLRRARRRLSERQRKFRTEEEQEEMTFDFHLGRAWFTTWADRVPKRIGGGSSSGRNEDGSEGTSSGRQVRAAAPCPCPSSHAHHARPPARIHDGVVAHANTLYWHYMCVCTRDRRPPSSAVSST